MRKARLAGLVIAGVLLLLVLVFRMMEERGDVDTSVWETDTQVQEESESSHQTADTGWCVVLDAGHGASDSGKVGVNGALEKDINLSIMLKLREYLEQKGIMVVLTRVDDSPLYKEGDVNHKLADMKKRLDVMEAAQPDAVVSIHQNSYTKETVKGPQVFYYAASTQGEKLAQNLQDCFDLVVGEEQNTRTIKPNRDYYLLVHTPYTIVICECGFLSNPEEADLLITDAYQEKIAEALSEGIFNYLSENIEKNS